MPALWPGPSLVIGDTRGINYGHRKPKITLYTPCHHPHLPSEKCLWRFCQASGCPALQPPPDNRLAISKIFQRILPPTAYHLLSATLSTPTASVVPPSLAGQWRGLTPRKLSFPSSPGHTVSTHSPPGLSTPGKQLSPLISAPWPQATLRSVARQAQGKEHRSQGRIPAQLRESSK